MLRWKSLFANNSDKGRLPKGVRRKQRAQAELSRRSRLERLEDRQMLAVDVFIDAATGFVTIKDESGVTGGDTVQEDNRVLLGAASVDPDGAQGAGVQNVLVIQDAGGVNAIGPGIFQNGLTQVFVPLNFDSDPGAGITLTNVLTATVVIDLQDGDDDLFIDNNAEDIPVVTEYDVRGGSNGSQSDQLILGGSIGVAESVSIAPSNVLGSTNRTSITGYAGVTIESRGYESIQYEGVEGDDDLTVNLGNGEATARVQHATTANTDEVLSDRLPDIRFNNVNDFVLEGGQRTTVATFVMDVLNNNRLEGAGNYRFVSNDQDTLIIEGDSDDDRITVSLDSNGDLQVNDTDVTINTTRMIPNDNLRIHTNGGDDTLTVNVSNTELISTPIFYDGGIGADTLITTGNPTPAQVDAMYTPGLQPDEGRLGYDDNDGDADPNGNNDGDFADMRIDFDNLEPVVELVTAATYTVNGNGANNSITLAPDDNPNAALAAARGRVLVDGFEVTSFRNKGTLILNARAGDDTVVANISNTPAQLTAVTINAGDGADTVRLEDLPAGITPSVMGDGGDDVIDASTLTGPTTLNGGAGDDTITGGAGVDTIVGGAGDDTFVDSMGDDTYDGGTGIDTLSFIGTSADDVIDVFQNAPSNVIGNAYTLNATLNAAVGIDSIVSTNPALAPNDATNLPTIERFQVSMLAGDDAIRVGHAHAYDDGGNTNGIAAQSIRFEVEGDAPNASDLLVVRDDLIGNTVIQRLGADQRSGSVTVGGLAPVDYSGIEQTRVLPIEQLTSGTGSDGLGQLVVFKNDPYEANDTLQTATFLGAGPTINVDPTIDPGGGGPFEIPGDADFYQFVAQETGTLDFQLYFEPVPTLANGNAGLPGDGELTATFFDSDGNPVGGIGGSSAQNMTDGLGDKIGERITVPVVENQTYYVRVQGDTTAAINVYNFTAINVPAPIPELVDLVNTSDTGRNDTDDITNDTTSTYNIVLDDDRIDAFANLNLVPDTVNDNAQTLNNGAGAQIDYGIEVFNNGVSIGFAFFTAGNTWSFTAANGDLLEGDGNHISAGVWIRDRATPSTIDTYEMSPALQVTLDTIAPPISFGLVNTMNATDGLFDGSDTGTANNGASFSDRVTSDSDPTLWGLAEANTVVSLWLDANGDGIIQSAGAAADIFLGQTVANPLDGNLAFPPGYWQISSAVDLNDLTTINSTGGAFVRDGARPLLVTAQDQAGNPVPVGAAGTIGPAILDALTIFLDTQGPQITGVSVNAEAVPTAGGYDLFDPKPSVNGPSPLVNSITINFADLPLRSDVAGTANAFIYPALDPTIAGTIGNYSVVGDANGQIVITSATVNQAVRLSGTVTAAAAANATTVTDAGLAAGTVAGDFIVFNNGAANGLTRRITNVAGGVLTIDAAFGAAQVGGDGFSIVPAASILNAGALIPNSAAQSAINSTANTTTTFTVGNIAIGPAVGDYVYFNTGVNAGQIQRVSGVAGFAITVANAFTMVPAAGDTITLIDPANTGFGTTVLNTASVTLNFAQPLPDDRFTVTVSDNLVDPVGNQLDGESNATTPTATPTFPTGDGVTGGAFAGRFTIDTRPEIGVWAAGIAQIDINGNRMYDPENVDATNRDLSFQIGFSSDNVFAGKFGVSPVTGFATGFDTLAAYGRVGNQWRWMIDTNHDGTITVGTDIVNNDGLNINGMPVAGNFDGNLLNGDEIGVFDGTTWYLDTNRSFTIDAADTTVGSNYMGYPIVGDFNGDGTDDLGAYTAVTNQFGGNLVSVDTNRDGAFDTQFRVGFGGGNANGFNMFPGVRERAVAADMDADGVDDIGFWVPDGTALSPGDQGEWFFLVSGGNSLLNRVTNNFIAYTTTPFGNDFSARFGNSFAVPLVGNFDPPVVASSGVAATETPSTEARSTRASEVESQNQTPTVDSSTVSETTEEILEPEVTPEVVPVVVEAEPEVVVEPATEPVAETTPVVEDPVVERTRNATEETPAAEEVSTPVEAQTPAIETPATPAPTEAPVEPTPVVEQHRTRAVEQTDPSVATEPEAALEEVVVESPILPPEASSESEQETTTPTAPVVNEEAEEVSGEPATEVEPPADVKPVAVVEPAVESEPVVVVEPPAVDQPGVPDSQLVPESDPVDEIVETLAEPVSKPNPPVRIISSANWWSSGRSVRRTVATPAKPVVPQVEETTPTKAEAAAPVNTTPVEVVKEVPVAAATTTKAVAPTAVAKTPTSVPSNNTPAVATAAPKQAPAAQQTESPDVTIPSPKAAVTEPAAAQPVATQRAATQQSLHSIAFAMSLTGTTSSHSRSRAASPSQQASISTSDLAEYNANSVDAAFAMSTEFRATETLELDERDAESARESNPQHRFFADLARELFGF